MPKQSGSVFLVNGCQMPHSCEEVFNIGGKNRSRFSEVLRKVCTPQISAGKVLHRGDWHLVNVFPSVSFLFAKYLKK